MSWKIFHGGPGKVLDFFVSNRVGTLNKLQYKQNMSIIALSISAFIYTLNRGTVTFKWRDRITCTSVLNISA